jgi:drug/metabolite transporter (DMT)-like permease
MNPRDRLDLLLLGVIWGASFLFMRVAVPEFGPVPLAGIRIAIAAAFLLAILAWRRGARTLLSSALPMTALGAANSALPFTLFAYATLHITAGAAAVVNASTPLFAAVIAFFWLRHRLAPVAIVGLVIGFGGVVILVWDRISFGNGSGIWAPLAGLAGGLSYGFAANYAKQRLHGVTPLASAAGSLTAAALLLLPLVVAYWPSVTPRLLSWLCVIVLGVACTAIAYILYFRLIARIGPAKTVTVTYLVPFFGMLWGLVFLGERITTNMLVACAVILLGTALATGSRSQALRSGAGALRLGAEGQLESAGRRTRLTGVNRRVDM